MSLEANKALVRRQFEELIKRKNLAVIDSDMSMDFVDHEATPGLPPGLDGVRAWIGKLHEACPDFHATQTSPPRHSARAPHPASARPAPR
jgi:hypothetical protein